MAAGRGLAPHDVDRRSFLAGAGALLLAGCAAPPRAARDNILPASFLPPTPGALIVMLPTSSHDELGDVEMRVRRAMYRQLTAQGYKSVLLDANDYRELMDEAVAARPRSPEAGTLRNKAYGAALSDIAASVKRDTGAALVMQPRLMARVVPVSRQDVIVWDGQRRFLETLHGGGGWVKYTGTVRALSIRLEAFGEEGRLAFRMHGGVAPLYRMDLDARRQQRNEDVFKDEYLEDAVRIVLAPLRPSSSA